MLQKRKLKKTFREADVERDVIALASDWNRLGLNYICRVVLSAQYLHGTPMTATTF